MNTISVKGYGEIHIAPDTTSINISVTSVFTTYAEAYERAKENASGIGKILVNNHLTAETAKTTHLEISDNIVRDVIVVNDLVDGCQEVKNGVKLNQCISVDIGVDNVLINNILDDIGQFLQDAQIQLNYTLKDEHSIRLQVLEKAVKDATEKATIMANAAGCTLGMVESIQNERVERFISQVRHTFRAKRVEYSNPIPNKLDITPEDLLISDYVDITWQLLTQ